MNAPAIPELRTLPGWNDFDRSPACPDGDEVLFDEPGRVLVLKPEGNSDVCFRAYHFRVTRRHGSATLRVRHGGGEESWRLPCGMVRAFAAMTSDARYFAMHAIMDAHHESARGAAERTALTYREAFVNGRLRKRKVRGQNAVKVWIERA